MRSFVRARRVSSALAGVWLMMLLAGCAGAPGPAPQAGRGEAAAARPTGQTREHYQKLGAEYAAQGDYQKAFDAYAKAEDKPALSDLAEAAFKAGSYDLFVRCWQEARKTVVFRETFADNGRAWNVRSDSYGQSLIQDGKLTIKRSTGSNTSFFWTQGGIDADHDFTIEALVARTAGSLTRAVSLAWGIVDADANFQFGISGDGSYLYAGYTAGKYRARIDWKKSPAIRTGLAQNKLGVRRHGARLDFYINDQLVDSAPFEGLPGPLVGVSAGTPLEVDVSSFTVEISPLPNEPLDRAGDAALAASDTPTAIHLYGDAGNTDKLAGIASAGVEAGRIDQALNAITAQGFTEPRARLRLASLLVQAGKKAESLAQLEQAGWKLGSGLARLVVRETFDDNSRDWAVLEDKSVSLQVVKGSYRVATKDSSGRSTWNPFAIDPDADFKIETRMRKLAGADSQYYSLIWGFAESSQRQDFGVTGSGGFEYGYFGDGKWHSVLKVEKSPAVRTGSADNLLAVAREGDRLGLFLNGIRVGQVPFRNSLGPNVGFSIDGTMSAEVASLDITEYPPEFGLDLARTELYADRPMDFLQASASLSIARGQYEKALPALLLLKDNQRAKECELRLGAASAAAGDPGSAAGHYQRAGSSPEALRGLAAAYDALGQPEKAEEPKAALANLLLADGKREEALALYLQLTTPARRDAAGSRLLAAGRFLDAAGMFKSSGNAAKEKECYGRAAEQSVSAGKISEAIALYRKAGSESRAITLEKKLVGLAASPQIGETSSSDSIFGLRIVDTNGFTIEIGEPSFSTDTPFLKSGENDEAFPLGTLSRADFDWKKGKVSVKDGETGDIESFSLSVGEVQLKGFVYQAGIACAYRIDLPNVKSITRIAAAAPADGHPDKTGLAVNARLTDAKGANLDLADVRFYNRGTFDSGYAYNWGFGSPIQGKLLDINEGLTLALGQGTYDVPVTAMSSLSFRGKSYLSTSGLRCPFVGKPDLVVLAGQAPNGRAAFYPSSIAEMSFTVVEYKRQDGFAPKSKWTVACSSAGAPTPFLNLSHARSEVYSPDIEWGTTDGTLAFRAALEDFMESGTPTEDRSSLTWDKTWTGDSLPLQVGLASWAVPFASIKEFGLDAQGQITVRMKDGSVVKGSPYKNWKGLVGDSTEGETRLSRQKIPARVAFLESGTVQAMALSLSGSLKESQESPYGQRGYLSWAMDLTIENSSGSAFSFGSDILLLDCTRNGLFDGAYVAYAAGAPGKDPAHSDFDAESQAYSLANYERWWSDGTMRGFRNGGTYSFGDPPEHKAEATICNSTLGARASVKLAKEFTQGTYVDPHDRVLVVLPVLSGPTGKSRLVLEFVKPDPSTDTWRLDSARTFRLTRADLLAALSSAKDDPPLGVLALHWLAAVNPSAAAPVIERNIRGAAKGLPLVASIQLLANSGREPSPEALSALTALADGSDNWSARAAARYIAARKGGAR